MAITADDKLHYDRYGYLLVKGVIPTKEAAALREEAHDLIQRVSDRDGSEDPTWNSARNLIKQKTTLQHCHNVQFESATFAKLLLDTRITDLAAVLMETENIQLHHNKAFIKPPSNGSPFPMHQDSPYFPHENHSMTACIIHLDDAPLNKGCIRVVPGSHKEGQIEHVADPDGLFHLPFEEYPIESAAPCEAEAGDVLFFNYLTIHGSGVNTSDEARTTLLVQMRDASDPPTKDIHTSRGQGMMLRGVNTGVGLSSMVQPLTTDDVKDH